MVMWKQQSSSATATLEPLQPDHSAFEPAPPAMAPAGRYAPPQACADQSIFTQGITVRGQISGPDSIYVDGTIEGSINIPGERVTVGPNGIVSSTSKAPCITAREIVVLGKVRGNIVATDRLEIRATGSVTGNVSTMRLKIEDGSHFQGGIEIREAPAKVQRVEEQEHLEGSYPDLDYAEAAV